MIRTHHLALALLVCTACLKDVRLGDLPADAAPQDALADPDASAELDAASAVDAEAPDAAPASDAEAPDAAPADAGVLDEYQLTYTALSDATCVDALAARQAEFSTLGFGDCGLAEGAVTLIRTSTRSWTIGGPAISASFGRAAIRMAAGVFPDQPPELLVSTLFLSGAGPLATLRRSGAIGVDHSNATERHVDGFVGVELANADDSGSCFLTFEISVDR